VLPRKGEPSCDRAFAPPFSHPFVPELIFQQPNDRTFDKQFQMISRRSDVTAVVPPSLVILAARR
jgi:hypothetical protein